jgi:hypothetical protein
MEILAHTQDAEVTEEKARSWAGQTRFWVLCIALIWGMHSVAYFVHEYAHSGTAWLLGYKSNPLAIEYGRFNLPNRLTFHEVDENVDYPSIFAQGHWPRP